MTRPTYTLWEVHEDGTRTALGTYRTKREANEERRLRAVVVITRTGERTHTVIVEANPQND